MFFYPRVTEALLENAGKQPSEYKFSFTTPNGEVSELQLTRGRDCTLIDPNDIWKLKEDGFTLSRKLEIEYPERLKGPNGVIPKDGRALPCILWNSTDRSSAGVILPEVQSEEPSLICRFEKTFSAGSIYDGLTLDLVMFVSQQANCVQSDEMNLMNEAGVLLGNIEPSLTIDFSGGNMEFPIEEFEEQGGPLWRMQFESWSDPREDLFSSASFTLLLNAQHPDCPKITNGEVSNLPLLKEILGEAYFLLFERVHDFDEGEAWDDMINDSDLLPESICSVLHWFSERGDEPFIWSTPEERLISIKRIIEQGFAGSERA